MHQQPLNFTGKALVGDITARKHKGNKQSVEAHRSTNKERDCQRIVDYLRRRGWEGATCYEISVALEMPYQTSSARCADLQYKLKSVVKTDRRRPTRTGNMAAVLVLR